MTNNIVITRLIGGLGNQMFQYAAGRSLAARHGAELYLDISGFDHYDLRRYELEGFRIQAKIADNSLLEEFGLIQRQPTVMSRLFERLFFAKKPPLVFKENGFAFNQKIIDANPPVCIDGYWQSDKYFSEISNEIRGEFSLQNMFDENNQSILKKIHDSGEKSVSLHVRRGDYVTNPGAAKVHGVCGLDYYRLAIIHIEQRVRSPHFFVFSDDHEWARINLNIRHPVTFVDINGPDKGIYDLSLMKECNNHIIANSSFSWWGAWLCLSENKFVISPKRWFNESQHDTRDLIPDSWVRL